MAVYREESQVDIQTEVETGGQDGVQKAIRSLIPVLSRGPKACLSLAGWLLKQIPLPCGASRTQGVDFLYLPPESNRGTREVQRYPVSVP